MQKTLKALRLPAVKDKVGLSTSEVYELMALGLFPPSRQLTLSGRAVAWFEHEVDEWLLSRPVSTVKGGEANG